MMVLREGENIYEAFFLEREKYGLNFSFLPFLCVVERWLLAKNKNWNYFCVSSA